MSLKVDKYEVPGSMRGYGTHLKREMFSYPEKNTAVQEYSQGALDITFLPMIVSRPEE